MTGTSDRELIATIRAHARGVEEARARAVEARRQTARRALPALVEALARDFGVQKIFLFGSLASGTPDERSDIDLAVQGLAPPAYFRALGSLLALSPLPVDLVRLEDAPPGLVARIHREGVALLDAG